MTNITKLYQQLQEGKTTRDYFVREARRQFPQFISPVSSFNDIVNILKGKRLVSEELKKEVSGAFFDAPPATTDEAVSDSIMQQDLESKASFAIGDIVVPNIGPHKGTKHKVIHIHADGFVNIKPIGLNPKYNRYNLGAVKAKPENLKKASNIDLYPGNMGDEMSAPREGKINEAIKLDTEQILDRMSPYAVRKGIEVELKKERVIDKTTLDKVRARVAKKLQKNKDAYSDQILTNVKDVEKKDKELETKEVKQELVDKKNAMRKPKGFKAEKANTKASKKENKKGKPKGVKVMPDKGVIGTEKVIKESVFDEDEKYFDDLEQAKAKAKAISAAEGVVQHVNELPNGGYVVEDWYDNETTVASYGNGVMIEQSKNEAPDKLYKHLKEWLEERVYREYRIGMEVKTPDGPGLVKEVSGGTLTVELQDEEKTVKDYQFNIVNKMMDEPQQPEESPIDADKAASNAAFSKLPNLGNAKGTDSGVAKSLYKGMTLEQKLKLVIDRFQTMKEGEKKKKALEIVKKKLKETKALVVPKTATPDQINKMVSTDPEIKPGKPLEIIRK